MLNPLHMRAVAESSLESGIYFLLRVHARQRDGLRQWGNRPSSPSFVVFYGKRGHI